MLSYPVGGTPITSFIGSDVNDLKWTVTHPLGSQVILNVVDSTGGSGGILAEPLTVVAGPSTSCIETNNNVELFVVSANVSGSLSQCEAWGVTVTGGFPPYIVMLGETNSQVVTNSTPLSGGSRVFPKRVNLGGELIVAVADALGRWATGTPTIQLEGSTDEICGPAVQFTSLVTVSSRTTTDTRPATLTGSPSTKLPSTPTSPPAPGIPAIIQIEIVFQSPQTGPLPTPTPMPTPTPTPTPTAPVVPEVTTGEILPNFMTTLTLSDLPTLIPAPTPVHSSDPSFTSPQPFSFSANSPRSSSPLADSSFPSSSLSSSSSLFSSLPPATKLDTSSAKNRTKALSLGLSIPLALMLVCGGLWYWYHARQRNSLRQQSDYQQPVPFMAMSDGLSSHPFLHNTKIRRQNGRDSTLPESATMGNGLRQSDAS